MWLYEILIYTFRQDKNLNFVSYLFSSLTSAYAFLTPYALLTPFRNLLAIFGLIVENNHWKNLKYLLH